MRVPPEFRMRTPHGTRGGPVRVPGNFCIRPAHRSRMGPAQYVDADRAMLGSGDFVLRPEYSRHRVTLQDWRRMTSAQRQKAQDQCFRMRTRNNTVTSTDGTLTVNSAPTAGRKPHQRKRPAAEKTTTWNRRQRPPADKTSDDAPTAAEHVVS